MDLFASGESTHCPQWFSLADTPSPLSQDVPAHNWPNVLLYGFPPIGPHIPSTLEDPSGVPQAPPGGSFLASQDMVSSAAQALLQLANAPPCQERSPISTGGRILHPNPAHRQLWVWPLEGRWEHSLGAATTSNTHC